jgi:hypothetical protein
MKTKRFCTRCDEILDTLTAVTRQLVEVCSNIGVIVESEGRTDSPNLEPLLAQTRALTAECTAIRTAFQDHRAAGHVVKSTFACSPIR